MTISRLNKNQSQKWVSHIAQIFWIFWIISIKNWHLHGGEIFESHLNEVAIYRLFNYNVVCSCRFKGVKLNTLVEWLYLNDEVLILKIRCIWGKKYSNKMTGYKFLWLQLFCFLALCSNNYHNMKYLVCQESLLFVNKIKSWTVVPNIKILVKTKSEMLIISSFF